MATSPSLLYTALNPDMRLRFVTSVKYSASIAKMLNNITFFQDYSWKASNREDSTLPLVFFFVKKFTEQSQSEVSSKPMLFYNSVSEGNNEVTHGGLRNVVADNIILKPKEYRMEILLPFKPDAVLDQYYFDIETMNDTLAFMTKNKLFDLSSSHGLSVANRTLSITSSILRTLFTTLCGDDTKSSLFTTLLGQNDINKRSLDAMWENRNIIKMKMWNGWNFKYLVIKNMDLTKSGEIDGYYEGTIQLQELPVLTVSKEAKTFKSKSLYLKFKHKFTEVKGKAVFEILKKLGMRTDSAVSG